MQNNLGLNFPNGTSLSPSQSTNYWSGNGYSADNTNYFYSYGYPQGNVNYGYVAPVSDVTINQVSFKFDPVTDTWCREEANSKGKVKIKTLTSGFTIIGVYKNNTFNGDLRFVVINYISRGKSYSVLMSGDDYIRERFHKYFRDILRYPGCTKSLFDTLVSFLLHTAPSQDFILFEHQGWNEFEDGKLSFAFDDPYIPRSMLSESVRRRKVAQLTHSPQEIIDSWLKVYANNPTTKFLGYYRIGSLFQHFLHSEGVNICQYLIAEPSEKFTGKMLEVLLATGDIRNYPITTLEAGEDNVIKEYNLVFDGTVLFKDDSFADEENKRSDSLKTITRLVRQEASNDGGNGLIAVISNNAAFTATRLSAENVIVINTDGTNIDTDMDTIRATSEEMDSMIINTVLFRADEIKKFFADIIPNLRRNAAEKSQGESLDTAIMVYAVELFFRQFLGFQMLDDNTFNCFLSNIDCKKDRIMEASRAIEKEFSSILSNLVRFKAIVPKMKLRNMTFDNDGKSFLVDGNRLYFPSEIIKAVLAQMMTTKSLESLMRALKHTKVLNATDGNTHPIEVHSSTGEHQRLYMYDVSAEILDADVLYKIHNIESEAFLFDENETPQKDFLTILNNGNGCVAGKQICYKDAENGHFYITGQSGWGKTYLLCQLIAKYFKLGHRVVIFDSSDSFTYEALCRNLSKVFVDNFVEIYDLDKDGIPVDLFEIDYNASLPTKKKLLIGILQAGIGELSAPQANTLRTLLSEVITALDKDEKITCKAILDRLKGGGNSKDPVILEKLLENLDIFSEYLSENGMNVSELDESDRMESNNLIKRLQSGGGSCSATSESLLNRFEPLFEDIEECGMIDRTWNSFLGCSKKITIIRTDSAYTESGNQLIDMLLATLYNYQHDNPQVALDIFIDEIQNQNFSKTGPIRKVMKEGRKIHMSFFGATQDYYPRNTELGSVMGKAGTQIFLRPTPNSANVVAAELRFTKADMERFDSMMRGDIIVKANLFDKKLSRNVPTTLSGHVDDYPKFPDNYYSNVL
ncbi:MAG: type IV secretion system DNA-binding domain-containing protein [Ruminococcus sp.]|nr:type IV secretion system DNA-binding domain-containing protein [Ruminococcus sp.]